MGWGVAGSDRSHRNLITLFQRVLRVQDRAQVAACNLVLRRLFRALGPMLPACPSANLAEWSSSGVQE